MSAFLQIIIDGRKDLLVPRFITYAEKRARIQESIARINALIKTIPGFLDLRVEYHKLYSDIESLRQSFDGGIKRDEYEKLKNDELMLGLVDAAGGYHEFNEVLRKYEEEQISMRKCETSCDCEDNPECDNYNKYPIRYRPSGYRDWVLSGKQGLLEDYYYYRDEDYYDDELPWEVRDGAYESVREGGTNFGKVAEYERRSAEHQRKFVEARAVMEEFLKGVEMTYEKAYDTFMRHVNTEKDLEEFEKDFQELVNEIIAEEGITEDEAISKANSSPIRW